MLSPSKPPVQKVPIISASLSFEFLVHVEQLPTKLLNIAEEANSDGEELNCSSGKGSSGHLVSFGVCHSLLLLLLVLLLPPSSCLGEDELSRTGSRS